jgi:hypothetical protein
MTLEHRDQGNSDSFTQGGLDQGHRPGQDSCSTLGCQVWKSLRSSCAIRLDKRGVAGYARVAHFRLVFSQRLEIYRHKQFARL